MTGGVAATAFAIIPGNVQAMNSNAKTNSVKSESLQKPLNGIYNIMDFGAKGDGTTLDTSAINKTIEYCGSNGGGTLKLEPQSWEARIRMIIRA